MAKISTSPVITLVGGVVSIGVMLHVLHEAADGYAWAAQLAGSCPVCHFRRNG